LGHWNSPHFYRPKPPFPLSDGGHSFSEVDVQNIVRSLLKQEPPLNFWLFQVPLLIESVPIAFL
jgi:hypothetical protein